MQANITGNVDIVVSNGAYATFRGGNFHDHYTDTGVSHTTNYTYQTTNASDCAASPGESAGSGGHAEHAARADHR